MVSPLPTIVRLIAALVSLMIGGPLAPVVVLFAAVRSKAVLGIREQRSPADATYSTIFELPENDHFR